MKYLLKDLLDKEYCGWLKIKHNSRFINLCYYTSIELISNSKTSQLVKVIDGTWKNQYINIPYKYQDTSGNISFLSTYTEDTNELKIAVDKENKKLIIDSLDHFKIVVDENILKNGKYFIQIPVAPIEKPLNQIYFDENKGGSRFANTWFRLIPQIGTIGEYYLHYGLYSKGCVTVINNLNKSVWNNIYLYLIKKRINQDYIGSIEVF